MANAHRAPGEGHGASAMVSGNGQSYSAKQVADQVSEPLPPIKRRQP